MSRALCTPDRELLSAVSSPVSSPAQHQPSSHPHSQQPPRHSSGMAGRSVKWRCNRQLARFPAGRRTRESLAAAVAVTAVMAPAAAVRQHPALQAMCPSFRSDTGSRHLLVSHCICEVSAHMLMRNGPCRLLHACCQLRRLSCCRLSPT